MATPTRIETNNDVEAATPQPPSVGRISEDDLQDQTSRLPFKKLVVVFACLMTCMFLSFLDSTSISTALPAIAKELGAAERITWVGISFLVANTSSQIIIARLSDIFGRKVMLICVVLLFALGNVLCGFAQSALWLFITRAISGIGGGGINSLVMIVISDIVSMRERGKYQGLIGSAVATGSGIGPLFGGLFGSIGWRWVFWFTVPISVLAAGMLWWLLPLTPVQGAFWEKVRQVDFLGAGLSLVSIVLVLVPLSGGGSFYDWKSPMVIVMLVVGGTLIMVFLLVEWKWAAIPMLPLRLLGNKNVLIVSITTMGAGVVYWSNLFFLPEYYIYARAMAPVKAGLLLLPLIVTQVFSSTGAGQILMRTGRSKPTIVTGFCLWTIALGLQTLFNLKTTKPQLVALLLFNGVAAGMTLQTTLVLAQASVLPKDRAVVTGTRNFCRTFGGSIGLVIGNTTRNLVLKARLAATPTIAPHLIDDIIKFGPNEVLSSGAVVDEAGVRRAFQASSHAVFLIFVPIIGVCALLTFLLKDEELAGDKPAESKTELRDLGNLGESCLPSSKSPSRHSSGELEIAQLQGDVQIKP